MRSVFFGVVAVLGCACSAMAAGRVELKANGGLEVDGKPFVPVMVWAQPSANLERLKKMGMNVVHPGEKEALDPLKGFLDKAHALGMLVLPDESRFSAELKDHPAVLAWTVEHEPDLLGGNRTEPERGPDVQKAKHERIKREAPGALTWAVYGAGFYAGKPKSIPKEMYREYFQHTDILSFDHYPVTGWNQPGWLPEVGLATKAMVEMSRPGQPVWTIVEASDQELTWTAPQTKGPTPAEMRAEVWSSFANGAQGIGYFTISFGRGKQFQWINLTPEMEQELARVNADVVALAGPIAAGEVKALTVSGDEVNDEAAKGRAIQARRIEYQGKTWIVAVNVSRTKVTPTFVAEGLGAGELAVWKAGKKVKVENGRFSDEFEPLGVWIYTDAE